MKELIDVFRMDEVSPKIRARIIIKLGSLVNEQYCSNISEPLVCELVKILDPQNDIFTNAHYIKYI